MAMFKGFSPLDIHTLPERFMIQVLAEQLAKGNEALEAMSEELKALKKDVKAAKNLASM